MIGRLAPQPGLVVVGEGYERWLAANEPRDPGGRGDARDVIVQMYTSGTTGVPKGVLTTHANLAVTAQTSAKIAIIQLIKDPLQIEMFAFVRKIELALKRKLGMSRFTFRFLCHTQGPFLSPAARIYCKNALTN